MPQFDSGNGGGGGNQAPGFAGIPSQLTLYQGATLDLSAYASDPNSDTMTFALQVGSLPSGVTLGTDGIFTATAGATIGTSSGLVVRVSDGSLTDDSPAFDLIVSANVAPAYVPGTAFQAAALSSVSNGHPTPLTVPSTWDETLSPDGSRTGRTHIENSTDFSGGTSAPDLNLLLSHGGGHDDGGYNGILQFDVSGTTQATGWSERPGSASDMANLPTAAVNHADYGDGRPTSTHTYDTLFFNAARNRMYRSSGSAWRSGTQAADDWHFDFDTNAWTRVSSRTVNFAFGADLATIYSEAADKALLIRAGQGCFWRLADDTFSGNISGVPSAGFHYHGAYDPTRNRGFFLGNGSTGTAKQMGSIDWVNETVSFSAFTTSGDDAIFDQQSFSIFYDPTLDRFWMFGGRTAAFDKMYWVDAADFDDGAVTVQSAALTGVASIPISVAYFGMVQRFLFKDDWRALFVSTTHNDPVHVIKLP